MRDPIVPFSGFQNSKIGLKTHESHLVDYFGICFLMGSSIASVQFLLRSRKKRVITGFLIASIAAIVGSAIWMLLPFVGQ